MANPISFPCTQGQQVGSSYTLPDQTVLEPSGLVVMDNFLYMVSDNGYLLRIDVSSGSSLNVPWTMVHNFTNDLVYRDNRHSYDLEAITVAQGQLMLGVEGSSKYDPHIIQYDQVNDRSTGNTWDMTDVTGSSLSNGGMEALTLVPTSACPSYGGSQYYGGYFFAAYQSKTGYVYVYDVPEGNGADQKVRDHLKKFPIVDQNGATISLKASDMVFADGYLFVLFDGGGTQDELHLFSINQDGTGLTHAAASYLPSIPGWTEKTDFEGITIDGSNLYLSVDANNSEKLVYQYSDYNINKFI